MLFPPLLVMKIWGIKQLWWKNGACWFYSLHNIPEEFLAVVIDKSYCSSTVTQPPCSSNLKKQKLGLSYQYQMDFLHTSFISYCKTGLGANISCWKRPNFFISSPKHKDLIHSLPKFGTSEALIEMHLKLSLAYGAYQKSNVDTEMHDTAYTGNHTLIVNVTHLYIK